MRSSDYCSIISFSAGFFFSFGSFLLRLSLLLLLLQHIILFAIILSIIIILYIFEKLVSYKFQLFFRLYICLFRIPTVCVCVWSHESCYFILLFWYVFLYDMIHVSRCGQAIEIVCFFGKKNLDKNIVTLLP